MTRLSERQPLCVGCWNERHPDRLVPEPHLEEGDIETCCDCGTKTRCGIYFRVDPATVRFPGTKE